MSKRSICKPSATVRCAPRRGLGLRGHVERHPGSEMVTREEVLDRVRSTMHDLFEVDPAKVTLDTRLIDDLGLDSIDAIDLAARLEEGQRKRLTEESLRKLRTVRDVVDL